MSVARFSASRTAVAGRPRKIKPTTSHARPLLLAAPAVDALAWGAWEAAVGGGGGPLVGGFHAAALPRRFSAKPRTVPNGSNGVAGEIVVLDCLLKALLRIRTRKVPTDIVARSAGGIG